MQEKEERLVDDVPMSTDIDYKISVYSLLHIISKWKQHTSKKHMQLVNYFRNPRLVCLSA